MNLRNVHAVLAQYLARALPCCLRRAGIVCRQGMFVSVMLSSASLMAIEGRAVSASNAKAEADAHFQKGVAAWKDRRFWEAAEEFEEAYRLSPAFQVLYNIGRANVALGHSAEALDAFQKYLDAGGSAISPERRREIEAELEKQRARVGGITVRTEPEGAEVRLDGKLVGKTPFDGPLRVTMGAHTIEAQIDGRLPQNRDLNVDGGAEMQIDLKLELVPTAQAPSRGVPPEMPPVEATPAPRAVPYLTATTAPPPTRASAGTGLSWRHVVGYALGASGVVMGVVGGVVVLTEADSADGAVDRATTYCDPRKSTLNTSECQTATRSYGTAKDRYQLGWVIAGAGGAVAIGGLVLLVTGSDTQRGIGSTHLQGWATTRGSGVALTGTW